MSFEESYQPGPKAAEFAKHTETMELSEIKKQIRSDLLSLNQKDELLNKTDRDVRDRLESVKVLFDSLKARFSTDPDIFLFGKAYEDLRGDFDRGEETDIDSTYASILTVIDQTLKESGVRKEAPDEKCSISDTVTKLKSMGIEPEYVVTSGNPKAKTVILFMQTHPNPGVTQQMADKLGITASQSQIEFAIQKMVESGLSNDIYEEGLFLTQEIRSQDLGQEFKGRPFLQLSASWRSKEKYGEKVHLKGYESQSLQPSYVSDARNLAFLIQKGELPAKNITPEQRILLMKFGEFARNRGTAINVFIASSMRDSLEKSGQQTSLMILGGAHEKHFAGMPGDQENPLPISKALAYYGMNVVVVDTTK